MVLKFRNSSIYYEVHGSGDPVVLLHGFLESSAIWDNFLPEFSKHGQVITVDLPGHGKSDCIEEVHTMELMADVVHAVLVETGIKKADFIGHSMGGYISLAFLEVRPEMVSSLMLLNSTPVADSDEKKEIRDRSSELVKKNKKAYISMAVSNLLTPESNELYKKEVEAIKETAYKFPVEGIIAALQGMKIRTDRSAVLKIFSGAKYIVAGKEDPLVNTQEIRKIAIETDCFFISLPGGHLSYLENNREFRKLCISSKI